MEVLYIQLLQGSPPHTRGTPHCLYCTCISHGITPAYAGNTPETIMERLGIEDHPRIRGEHLATVTSLDLIPGSPPHTRGTLLLQRWTRQSRRITPAYAGNTSLLGQLYKASEDHPRIRGEHFHTILDTAFVIGSPPHTRGTPVRQNIYICCRRITPAYAGNTGS